VGFKEENMQRNKDKKKGCTGDVGMARTKIEKRWQGRKDWRPQGGQDSTSYQGVITVTDKKRSKGAGAAKEQEGTSSLCHKDNHALRMANKTGLPGQRVRRHPRWTGDISERA